MRAPGAGVADRTKLIWIFAGLLFLALTLVLPAPRGMTVDAWRMAGIEFPR